MKKLLHVVIVSVFFCTLAYSVPTHSSANAQSSTRESRTNQPAGKQPFELRLWNWLHQSKYNNWAPVPGQNDDFYPGESPHGALLKMYLNRTAAGNPETLPHGSVLIKENYSPDKKLMAITVMYRAKDYDSQHNDWYWVKYNPNGSVANAPLDRGGMKLAGRVKGCINCHSDAGGGDFAFAND